MKNKVKFDYSKLKGFAREKYGSQEKMANKAGIPIGLMSMKINNHVDFNQTEIYNIVTNCGIPSGEIDAYFFTPKV